MACDVPCLSYMALYVISLHLVNSSSRSSASTSSQHWKLNLAAGKVEPAKTSSENASGEGKNRHNITSSSDKYTQTDVNADSNNDRLYEERMMQILGNKATSDEGWIVLGPGGEGDCVDCDRCPHKGSGLGSCSSHIKSQDKRLAQQKSHSEKAEGSEPLKLLSCGRNVNSTVYDHLKGISERHLHSHIPELEVATMFQDPATKTSEVDMTDLEQRLRSMRVHAEGTTDTEQRIHVYNLIGNFWRIKGNTQLSIECFRKALSISPDNSNVLLNLARVLLNLQYLEDSIFLAWRSLQLFQKDTETTTSSSSSGSSSSSNSDNSKDNPQSSPSSSPWLQHLTLGQALQALAERGSIMQQSLQQQAAAHFEKAVLLKALSVSPLADSVETNDKLDWLLEEPAILPREETETSPPGQLPLFLLLLLGLLLSARLFISLEPRDEGGNSGDAQLQTSSQQPARHFNRAMAMRSIKLGVNRRACPRHLRVK